MIPRFLTGLLLALASTASLADWSLDADASNLWFVSTKANVAAEVHQFRQLDGAIDADGNCRIAIKLASVDTSIEIRDERMREVLFETARFSEAGVSARVDIATVTDMPVGAVRTVALEATLAIRDTETPLTLEVNIARLADDRLLVTSTKPVVVAASQLDLADGVERLREIAGLPSISPAVPVTFQLAFDRD